MRLTTAKFYSPNGHPISHVGVEPDIVVHTAAKPLAGQTSTVAADAAEDDHVLAAGVQAARQLDGQALSGFGRSGFR